MQDRTRKGLETQHAEYTGKNESGWVASMYKVIVLKDAVKETYSEAGIVIAQDVRDTEEWTVIEGVIVDMGPKAFTHKTLSGKNEPDDVRPEVGQRVMLKDYVGQAFVGKDGKKYHVINDSDIHAWSQS